MDQHEASYTVGKVLKELYIDSALKQEEHRQKCENKTIKKKPKNPIRKITWKEFVAMESV